jgi:hypothetical protein
MGDPFELKVRQQIERLQSQDYRAIEAEVTQKRLAWLEQNHPLQIGQTPLSPRQAYQLLFFDYMGLSAEDLPVVQETESQITWLSKNPCSNPGSLPTNGSGHAHGLPFGLRRVNPGLPVLS